MLGMWLTLGILGFVTLIVSTITQIVLWTEVKAMQKSTHQVQYIRTDPNEFEKMTEALKEQLAPDPLQDNVM